MTVFRPALLVLCAFLCQDKLDPGNDRLSAAYVPADRVEKYGYLELEYPASFKTDGGGDLKTKPPIQSHSQSVPDDLREWLAGVTRDYERFRDKKAALGEFVRVLGDHYQFTRIVPYADRYVAMGGKLSYNALNSYVGGLARLGRTYDAERQHEASLRLWGQSMAANMSAQLFGDRFLYSWLVERNFKEMLRALEQGQLLGMFPAEANQAQETILSFLRKADERNELDWFVPRMEKHWIWLNEVLLKSAVEIFEKKGATVPAALLEASDPLFKGAPVPAKALSRRALQSLNRGDVGTALRQAERAVELTQPVGRQAHLDSLGTLIRVLRQKGDFERAYLLAPEAEKVAALLKMPSEIGWAYYMRGTLLERLGDNRRAADNFLKAWKIAVALEYPELTQTTRSALARASSLMGKAEEVEPTLREIAEAALAHQLYANVPSDYMNWGICLIQLRRYEEALKAFRQALAPVKGAGAGYKSDLTSQFNCRKGMGQALFGLKKYEEADKVWDEYAAEATRSLTQQSAWVWQLGKANCRRAMNQPADAQKWVDECLKSIDAERASLSDFQRRRTLNDNKYEAYELGIELALERGDGEAAFRFAERSRARSFLDEMGAHSGEGRAVAHRDLSGLIKDCSDIAAVVYYQLPDRLLAWVVADGKADLVTIPLGSKETQDRAHQFMNAIYLQSMMFKEETAGQKIKFDALEVARKFHQSIWAPVAGKIPPGKRTCIIPHRSLHYVPFQALHDGKEFLVESAEIFYAPSASALSELRQRPAGGASGVLIMDPILSDDPKSPFAKTETAALQKQYPNGKILLRKTATVAAFKELAKDAGVIHVSSHGTYNRWVPMESGLVFAEVGDPLLRAREIYRMKLDKTQLLVMSACVSSVGDLQQGDEVTGLTRAFQVAGVPNIIGSLWPVENAATTELMTLFHQSLGEHQDPVAALRFAQGMMVQKKLPIVQWAAFGLTGRGSALLLGK
jgi:CHAT domain-containing protein